MKSLNITCISCFLWSEFKLGTLTLIRSQEISVLANLFRGRNLACGPLVMSVRPATPRFSKSAARGIITSMINSFWWLYHDLPSPSRWTRSAFATYDNQSITLGVGRPDARNWNRITLLRAAGRGCRKSSTVGHARRLESSARLDEPAVGRGKLSAMFHSAVCALRSSLVAETSCRHLVDNGSAVPERRSWARDIIPTSAV